MPPTPRSIVAALLAGALLGAPAVAPAVAAAAPAPAPAPPAAPDASARATAPSAATMDALMRATRLGTQSRDAAEAVAGAVIEGFEAEARAAPPGTIEAVREIATAAFSPDRFEDVVAARLAGTLSEEDARRVAERATSPLWQRALDGEEAHDLDADPEGFMRFVEGFGRGPDDAERLAATGEILEAAGGAELIGSIVIDVRKAMVRGAALADPYAGPAQVDAALDTIEAGRAATVAQLGELLPMVLAWSYEDLSIKEVHALAAEARRPERRRFNAAASEAVRDALVLGSLEFADRASRATEALRKTSRI